MRELQALIDQSQLVHHLQCRGMHGVAAKIPEEIIMLFQNHDIDAGASEKIAEHHAGWPATDDAAANLDHLSRRLFGTHTHLSRRTSVDVGGVAESNRPEFILSLPLCGAPTPVGKARETLSPKALDLGDATVAIGQ